MVSTTLAAPGTSPLPTIGVSPYRWTSQGAALVVVGDGVEYQACITSTSTVVVQPEGALLFDPRGTYLRMYGLNTGVPAFAASGGSCLLQSSGNVSLPGLPVAYNDPTKTPDAPNIAYWDSNTVCGDGTLAAATDFEFRAVVTLAVVTVDGHVETQAPGVLTATAIAGLVGPRRLEGVVGQYAAYKDVHVLKLDGQVHEGTGWLMLAARYTADVPLGVGYSNPSPTNTEAAIVGFWSADPGFATDVRGPFFLVGRWHDLGFVEGGTPTSLWLGVPSVVELEADGERWLYVYYAAEEDLRGRKDEDPPVLLAFADWQPGTFVRRIRLDHLPWESFSGQVAVGDGTGGAKWVTEAAAADETTWDSTTEAMLVVGEALGKVRIWAAREPGTSGDKHWHEGEDPAAVGNVLVWDLQAKLKDVDGDVDLHEGGLSLYVALNEWGEDTRAAPHETNEFFWGIWRTAAGPAAAGRVYGTDFVLRWIDEADPGGEYDNVARSNPTDTGSPPWADKSQMRLDPDAVRVPSGEWVVFTGSTDDAEPPAQWPLERFDTTETNGDRRFGAAWRR